MVDIFINKVIEKDKLQKKYFETGGGVADREEFMHVLTFLTEKYNETGCDIDFIVDSYLFFVNMTKEETYYFVRNNKYRYSKFEEVDKIVYSQNEYMEKYMIGLLISQYIWTSHIKMIQYFKQNNIIFEGNRYLEIGPGFGQYLIVALLNFKFNHYFACDISKTSVEGSNKYLIYKNLQDRCQVEQKNFFDYNSQDKFDCIVMGEVLEHVENPMDMLKKIYELLNVNGKAFITTAINAPAIDHIFLFRSIEEVLMLVTKVGFKVLDYKCFAAGNKTLEKAIKKKMAIDIALILEKESDNVN